MLTKQRLGEAADMLNERYDFDRKSEFMGHKEEAVRELYNELRNIECGRRSDILLISTMAFEDQNGSPLLVCGLETRADGVLQIRLEVPAASPTREFIGHKEATTILDYRQVAARIWCDPAMSMKVMDVAMAEKIARSLVLGLVEDLRMEPCDGGDCGRLGVDCPACQRNVLKSKRIDHGFTSSAEPAQPTASQCLEAGQSAAGSPG